MKILLAFVMVLFIGILIATYAAARHANPQLLDEHGRPLASQTR